MTTRLLSEASIPETRVDIPGYFSRKKLRKSDMIALTVLSNLDQSEERQFKDLRNVYESFEKTKSSEDSKLLAEKMVSVARDRLDWIAPLVEKSSKVAAAVLTHRLSGKKRRELEAYMKAAIDAEQARTDERITEAERQRRINPKYRQGNIVHSYENDSYEDMSRGVGTDRPFMICERSEEPCSALYDPVRSRAQLTTSLSSGEESKKPHFVRSRTEQHTYPDQQSAYEKVKGVSKLFIIMSENSDESHPCDILQPWKHFAATGVSEGGLPADVLQSSALLKSPPCYDNVQPRNYSASAPVSGSGLPADVLQSLSLSESPPCYDNVRLRNYPASVPVSEGELQPCYDNVQPRNYSASAPVSGSGLPADVLQSLSLSESPPCYDNVRPRNYPASVPVSEGELQPGERSYQLYPATLQQKPPVPTPRRSQQQKPQPPVPAPRRTVAEL